MKTTIKKTLTRTLATIRTIAFTLLFALALTLTLAACSLEDLVPNGGDANDTPGATQGGSGGSGGTSDGSRNENVELIAAPPAIGEYIYFGDYDWQILDIQDGKALLLSNYVLENMAYHNEGAETIDDCEIVTWETCDLRAYLNGEFYDSFSADDRAKIVTVTNQNPDNPWVNLKP